jgi:hypothetical protein
LWQISEVSHIWRSLSRIIIVRRCWSKLVTLHRIIIRSVTHYPARLRYRRFRSSIDWSCSLLAIALHVINVGKRCALPNMRGWHWLRICTSKLIQILRLLLICTRHHPDSIALSRLLLNTGVGSNWCYVHDRVLRLSVLIFNISSGKSWLGPHRWSLVKSTSSELISLLSLFISSFRRLILINLILVIHCSSHILLVVLLAHLLHWIYLSLILHHLSSSKVVTLVANISDKLFLAVVASKVQGPVAWY